MVEYIREVTILLTIGPLITAFEFANPNDIVLTPSNSIGIISLGLSSGASNLCFSFPISVGNDGPYISASKIPTLYPNLCNEKVRLTATVLFPTPPLHEETAKIFFTFYRFPFLNTFSDETGLGAILISRFFIQSTSLSDS